MLLPPTMTAGRTVLTAAPEMRTRGPVTDVPSVPEPLPVILTVPPARVKSALKVSVVDEPAVVPLFTLMNDEPGLSVPVPTCSNEETPFPPASVNVPPARLTVTLLIRRSPKFVPVLSRRNVPPGFRTRPVAGRRPAPLSARVPWFTLTTPL